MENNNRKGGIGFCGLLTIVFITLKLCGVIEWSWVWVVAPIWIPLALSLFAAIVIVAVKYLTNRY